MDVGRTITLGPLSVPTVVVTAALVGGLAYGAGLLTRLGDGERRRSYTDLLLAPVLPFLLGWKFSLIITDAPDLMRDPLLLLYSPGSWLNGIIGVVSSLSWFMFRWRREKPSPKVRKALIAALITAVVSTSTILLVSRMEVSTEQRLPELMLKDENDEPLLVASDGMRPMLINLWASWCPPCRAEMPMLQRLYDDGRFSEVVFLTVNADSTEKTRGAGVLWFKENGFDMPLVLDPQGEALRQWQIDALPTTLVITPDGRIAARKTGAVSRQWLINSMRRVGP